MDKREMEMLMDRYKAEMLEFSRRNNTARYPLTDEREKEMSEAIEENKTFERDRSDPLPMKKAESERVEKAVPVQAQAVENADNMQVNTSVNVADSLRRGCRR